MKVNFFTITILTILHLSRLYGAVACSLTDPDRDIKRLFPKSTGYKTEYKTIKGEGGNELYNAFQERLGDKLDPIYEAIDQPYALYTVFKGKTTIGYVHGVNQKGKYGLIQLILAVDTTGKVLDMYYQKISSPEAKKLKSPNFTRLFVGLTLADFYTNSEKLRNIKDPTENNKEDFWAILRAVKKNLIIIDLFLLNRKNDKTFFGTKKGEK